MRMEQENNNLPEPFLKERANINNFITVLFWGPC